MGFFDFLTKSPSQMAIEVYNSLPSEKYQLQDKLKKHFRFINHPSVNARVERDGLAVLIKYYDSTSLEDTISFLEQFYQDNHYIENGARTMMDKSDFYLTLCDQLNRLFIQPKINDELDFEEKMTRTAVKLSASFLKAELYRQTR